MPVPGLPYDTVNDVMNVARVRLNDRIESLVALSGKILQNTQPFTQTAVNTAWRKLQEFLRDLGYARLKNEVLFSNLTGIPSIGPLPPAASTDPATQQWMSYSGFFDGVNFTFNPLFPTNFMAPLELWERPTGSNAVMTEMDRVLNGLPAVPKANWNRQWEWRDDRLFLPGALVQSDLRMRYAEFLPDFIDTGGTAPPPLTTNTVWYQQPVYITNSADSFASYICAELSKAREDMDGATAFTIEAEAKARLILNRETEQAKAIYKISEYSKMADRYTPNTGPDTQPVKR